MHLQFKLTKSNKHVFLFLPISNFLFDHNLSSEKLNQKSYESSHAQHTPHTNKNINS